MTFALHRAGAWRLSGTSLAIVLTLSLGVWACTTVFSIVNGVLLRPLPLPHPDELIQIRTTNPLLGTQPTGNAIADYFDWRDQSQVFQKLAIHLTLDFNLPGDRGETALPVRVSFASSELFSLLGVPAALGRTFVHAEEQPGSDLYTVILSHDLWVRRYGGSPEVIGKAVTLDSTRFQVVGVMPAGFRFPVNSDAWAPIESWFDRFESTPRASSRSGRGTAAIGRLRPGVGMAAVNADLDTVAARLEQAHPQTNSGVRYLVTPLRETFVLGIRPYLTPLAVGATLVVLIACLNVTNLLIARAADRRRDIAIRIALGITRGRLIQGLVVETLLLSVLGSLLGLGLSAIALRALEAAVPITLPYWMTFAIDWRVLSFVTVVAIAMAIPAGLAPAEQAFRYDHSSALKAETRASVGSRWARSRGRVLATVEVSLAFLLLVAAGLMLRTISSLHDVQPGLTPDHLLVAYISPPGDRYKATPPYPPYASLYLRLLERLQALPGVKGVAASRAVPFDGTRTVGLGPVTLDGQTDDQQRRNALATNTTVSASYFDVAGVPLLRGEVFSGRESLATPRVTIVSAAMARRLWPQETPLGKRLKIGDVQSSNAWHTVIGVVGDVRYRGLNEEPEPTAYYPFTQATAGDMNLLVRTDGPPLDRARNVEHTIGLVDPGLAVYSVRTMEAIVADSIWQQRLWGTVLGIFAAVALALAAVGIYGVLSWSVRQRQREMAVRLALGAGRRGVVALALGDGMRPALAGLVCGLLASLVVTRTLSAVLFGVSPFDTVILLVAAAAVAMVCGVACCIPAWHASRVDPSTVLK